MCFHRRDAPARGAHFPCPSLPWAGDAPHSRESPAPLSPLGLGPPETPVTPQSRTPPSPSTTGTTGTTTMRTSRRRRRAGSRGAWWTRSAPSSVPGVVAEVVVLLNLLCACVFLSPAFSVHSPTNQIGGWQRVSPCGPTRSSRTTKGLRAVAKTRGRPPPEPPRAVFHFCQKPASESLCASAKPIFRFCLSCLER